MPTWVNLSYESASTTVFTAAGWAAVAPVPFVPIGLVGEGISVRSGILFGISGASGMTWLTVVPVIAVPSPSTISGLTTGPQSSTATYFVVRPSKRHAGSFRTRAEDWPADAVSYKILAEVY